MQVLYILMRNDMASLNPGKAMAQASHASNAFIRNPLGDGNAYVKAWQESTNQGFGTVIVLGANICQIEYIVEEFQSKKYIAEEVFDPTYPLVDGLTIHHIPLVTCGYVFVEEKEKDEFAMMTLQPLSLHP